MDLFVVPTPQVYLAKRPAWPRPPGEKLKNKSEIPSVGYCGRCARIKKIFFSSRPPTWTSFLVHLSLKLVEKIDTTSFSTSETWRRKVVTFSLLHGHFFLVTEKLPMKTCPRLRVFTLAGGAWYATLNYNIVNAISQTASSQISTSSLRQRDEVEERKDE